MRQAWPDVRIILRADSGFCRHRMLGWCERQGIGYIVYPRGELMRAIAQATRELGQHLIGANVLEVEAANVHAKRSTMNFHQQWITLFRIEIWGLDDPSVGTISIRSFKPDLFLSAQFDVMKKIGINGGQLLGQSTTLG